MKEKSQLLRPTDESALALAGLLLSKIRWGALATLATDGYPLTSLINIAFDRDGTPLMLASRLSDHTTNLLADPRCSLLISDPGKGDPLAHPRLSLTCNGQHITDARETGRYQDIRADFLEHHPKSALYIDFPDFLFFRLDLLGARLNGGFGKAYQLTSSEILSLTACKP